MIRKLVVAMAAAGAIGTNSALALGLGDITLHSALNQPLKAEIELLEVRDLQRNEMLPSLAGRDDFIRAGVERAFFLTDLKFETIQRSDGSAYVKVTSDDPVREPFLNFLMEVQWPSGRLLREYTLLLDPPAYAETQSRRATLVSTPVSQSGIDPVDGQSYRVQANDSLWQIAAQMRPSRSVTVQQTMLAIQELNPDAFINGNINLLRKGAVLRLPSAAQVEQRSQGQAVAEVSQQNQAWQGQALDARVREQAKPQLPQDEGDGRLSILSPSSEEKPASAAQAAAEAGDVEPSAELESLQNELAISLENLDKVSRESEDLQERLSELEGQIATLEQLVNLKDNQLAELQDQLAIQGELAETPSVEVGQEPIAEAPVSEAGAAEVEIAEVVEQPLVEEPVTAEEPLVAETPESVEAPVAEVAEEPVQEPVVAEPEVAEVAEVAPVVEPEPEVVEEPKSVVAEPQPAVEEKSLIDSILANPLYLAGGGAVILLLALLLVRARRKGDESEEEAVPAVAPEADVELEVAEEPVEAEEEVGLAGAEADLSELDELEKQLQLDSGLEETEQAEAGADPIKEADIYVAYGRLDQAQELLEKAVAAEPERQDLRLKQLEVLAAMNEASAFETAAAELEPMADLDAQMRIGELRETLSGAEAVAETAEKELGELDFDLGDEAPAEEVASELAEESAEPVELDALDEFAVEEAEQESEDEFDLNLDDEFALDSFAEETEAEPETAEEALDLDSALDFDTALEEEPAEEAQAEEAPSLDSLDDEFDLSLSEPEEGEAAEEVTEPAAEDDELLSFDADLDEEFSLDEDLSLDAELEAPAEDALDEFDLSLTDEEEEISAQAEDVPELSDIEVPEVEVAEPESVSEAEEEFDLDFGEELDDALALDDSELEVAEDLDQALELDAELEEDLSLDEGAVTEAGLSADLEDLDEVAFEVEEPAEQAASEATEEGVVDDTLAAEDLTDIESLASFDEADAAAELDVSEDDEDFDLLGGTDEASTKLDLARAYIDMEDVEGAREILAEVISEGTDEQKQDAQELLAKLG